MRRALRLIQDGALDEASVDALAARLGIGPRHLHRLFVQHVGASPITVAQTRRLHFAKHLLDETDAADHGDRARGRLREPPPLQRHVPEDVPARAARAAEAAAARPRAAGGDEVVLRLAFRPPYDWAQVREFLATRAVPGVERVDARGYARTVACGRRATRSSACARWSGEHALELRVRGAAPAALFQLASAARRVFDLAADPARIAPGVRRATRCSGRW